MQKTEYEIFLPSVSSEGDYIEPTSLKKMREQIIKKFGNVIETKIKNKGHWRADGTVLLDDFLSWRIICDEGEACDDYVRDVQSQLERDLKEEKILVIKRFIDYLR